MWVRIFKGPCGMPSLLEALEAREVEVRGRLEELAGQVVGAQRELGPAGDRRRGRRFRRCWGRDLRWVSPGGDDRSARMSVRWPSPSPVGAGLPEAVAAALGVIERSDVPLRAREVCEALGEPGAGVQAMRNRLGRLASWAWPDGARAGPLRRAGAGAVSAAPTGANGDAAALEEAFAASRCAYRVLETQMTSAEARGMDHGLLAAAPGPRVAGSSAQSSSSPAWTSAAP